MARESITPVTEERYYAGDVLDIPFHFEDGNDDPIDLTGTTVEFRCKRSLSQSDDETLLERTGTEGENPEGLTFVDPENGICIVHIDTDDTSHFVTRNDRRLENVTIKWHIRIIDQEGDRITSNTGDWQVYSA